MSHSSKSINPLEERLERYAANFYIRHHCHGLGYLALSLTIIFLVIGIFAVIHVLAFMDTRAFTSIHYLMTGGCFVLAGICGIIYHYFAQQARDFALNCADGGNETYADVCNFYRSYTGKEP